MKYSIVLLPFLFYMKYKDKFTTEPVPYYM